MKRTEHYEEYLNTFEKIDLGGHICTIRTTEIKVNDNNKEMLIVTLDTNSDDVQPLFFQNQFINDQRQNKKWPNAATTRLVEGTPFIARFCSAVEDSNPGFTCWSSEDADGVLKTQELIGKKVGAVFGEVESIYNGRVITKREIRYFCNADYVFEKEIPKKKTVDQPKQDSLDDINWNEITKDVEGLPFN